MRALGAVEAVANRLAGARIVGAGELRELVACGGVTMFGEEARRAAAGPAGTVESRCLRLFLPRARWGNSSVGKRSLVCPGKCWLAG